MVRREAKVKRGGVRTPITGAVFLAAWTDSMASSKIDSGPPTDDGWRGWPTRSLDGGQNSSMTPGQIRPMKPKCSEIEGGASLRMASLRAFTQRSKIPGIWKGFPSHSIALFFEFWGFA